MQLRCALLFLCGVLTAFASDDDWSNLGRLKAGEKIDVVQRGSRTITGVYRSHTSGELVIEAAGAGKTFPKTAVARVSRPGRSHRLRNSILLGVVGAVAGAGIMRFGLACAETDTGCRDVKLATFGGAAAGAAIGAALPFGPETIYRVRR